MTIWTAAKAQLRLQMTQATFDTWIKETRQIGDLEDETLTIGVPTAFAQDWLEHRLIDTIRRTVESVAGQPLTLAFVIDNSPTATGDSTEANSSESSPEPGPGQIAIDLVSFDPTQRGFVMTSNYAVRFWQPYLRLFKTPTCAFHLWLTLKSFAYECERDVWPSIQTLADICGDGQRYKILGRAARKGCGRIVGALEILEKQRIVYVKSTGEGSKVSYRFRVLENLPLLTPRQLEELTPRLQRLHQRWLQKCEIDYEEWEQLSIPRLTDK